MLTRRNVLMTATALMAAPLSSVKAAVGRRWTLPMQSDDFHPSDWDVSHTPIPGEYLPLVSWGGEEIDWGDMDHNEVVIRNTLIEISQTEEIDARLEIILGTAQIESALSRAMDGQNWKDFRGLIALAGRDGVIDVEFQGFLDRLRLVRNIVAHQKTDRDSLSRKPLLPLVERMYETIKDIEVWHDFNHCFETEFRRCLFSITFCGILAAELRVVDDAGQTMPLGFNALRAYVASRPRMAQRYDWKFVRKVG
jgi:hypothetical protein